jgi:hypothetical protein
LAGRAIPDDHVRGGVAAGGQLVATGGRITADDPLRPNRFGTKVHMLRFDHQNWLSHFPQLDIPQLKQISSKNAPMRRSASRSAKDKPDSETPNRQSLVRQNWDLVEFAGHFPTRT